MNTTTLLRTPARLSVLRETRARILTITGVILVATFWFATRYPALAHKAETVGSSVSSMTYATEVITLALDAPLWQRILAGAANWLAAMKIGMTFGVLLGALLHTTLRHYPLRIGKNLTLNSLKGALIGMPMGVCANCAVPTACGITRGNGRLEVALGFLFSSPNFNPVVVSMTIAALPASMVLAKYSILAALILFGVPVLVQLFGEQGAQPAIDEADGACDLPTLDVAPREPAGAVLRELAREYGRHCWLIARPTIAIMLVASLLSSAVLAVLPLDSLLASTGLMRMVGVSALATLMPVPIALDVLFAAQLQTSGIAPGYVMLFLMTLGTYSIVPAIYLWREVSRGLSVALMVLFIAAGAALGMAF